MKIKLLLAVITALTLVQSPALAEVQISTKGGLKVQNGDYKFQFGGRIMYDFNRSEKNSAVDEDGFDLRRGRLYAKGNISKDWSFKSQFNVDGGGAEDLYLRYLGFGEFAAVTIGKQKVPFGLEELTSSKDISVLERSAITERYAEGRADGIQLSGASGNQSYGVMAFTNDAQDAEKGFAARYTIAPVKTDGRVLHFGLAYKDIGDKKAFGIEAAYTSGPLHIQAEYADGDETGNNDLNGYYVQAGYILTGESRPYSSGKFKRVTPKGKVGAWEAVLRYEDGDGNYGDIELGDTNATAYTIGLNYYAHKNVRLALNYTDGQDSISRDVGNELRVRFQLTF